MCVCVLCWLYVRGYSHYKNPKEKYSRSANVRADIGFKLTGRVISRFLPYGAFIILPLLPREREETDWKKNKLNPKKYVMKVCWNKSEYDKNHSTFTLLIILHMQGHSAVGYLISPPQQKPRNDLLFLSVRQQHLWHYTHFLYLTGNHWTLSFFCIYCSNRQIFDTVWRIY